MSKLSFKTYNRIMAEATTEEELNEIFGMFKNNDKIEKLRAEREALKKKREDAKKKLDKKWSAAKKAEQDEKNGGFDPMERGSMTMRSQAASGRSAERDWVGNMDEGKLNEGFRHARRALLTDIEEASSINDFPEVVNLFRSALRIMGWKVPQDKVYTYAVNSFKPEYTRIMRKLGVRNPSAPEMKDFKEADFEKVRSYKGFTFMKKDDVLVMVANDEDQADLNTVFVGAGEIGASSAPAEKSDSTMAESFELEEMKKDVHQLAREKIRDVVMPKLAELGANVGQRAVEDFFLGGGGGAGMTKFMNFLNKLDGFREDYESYEQIQQAMRKIGVTKQMFNMFTRAST